MLPEKINVAIEFYPNWSDKSKKPTFSVKLYENGSLIPDNNVYVTGIETMQVAKELKAPLDEQARLLKSILQSVLYTLNNGNLAAIARPLD
jgi:hypothetical protein